MVVKKCLHACAVSQLLNSLRFHTNFHLQSAYICPTTFKGSAPGLITTANDKCLGEKAWVAGQKSSRLTQGFT